MSLPLLVRAKERPGALAYITPRHAHTRVAPPAPTRAPLMPTRALAPGEQYRFHFDMRACIGCKCCVVACNEQNGNPASINWRRVGELEGGYFPQASRAFLSMGCNHCVEPSCLQGCPVDAYSKDPVTGIVRHSADACIGCQYCTWNCSYGVPQYNPERGVVGKCDMCHGRLELGQAPACVSACPEGAISIEIVTTADWQAAVAVFAEGAGLPSDDHSLSTTRISVPTNLPPDTRPREITHVVPEHPHWALIAMTVLTQLSAGAFAAIWLLQLAGGSARLGAAALVSLAVGCVALAAATFHLGRPAYAYRALRMWRRSWLSREVLLVAAFSVVAAAYAGMLWLRVPGSAALGGVTTLLGISGVVASASIYRVPSRPAWNTPHTILQFILTAALLGPLVAAAAADDPRPLALAAALAAGAQFVVLALGFFRCIASDSLELRGTARLLSTVFVKHVLLRGVLLAAGGVVLPLLAVSSGTQRHPLLSVALLASLSAEVLGRYLFFVTVVPRHFAAPYLPAAREAA